MRYAAAVLRHQAEVFVGPPAHPGVRVDEDGMAQQGIRAEDAELRRPLHRRHAVPADHLQHFAHALRDVHGERQLVLARGGKSVAQQLGRAGIDLHRRQHARQPARRVARQALGEREGGLEAPPAGLLVPFVLQLVIILELPARRGEARRQERAQAAALGERFPAVPSRTDIDDRGDAAAQQLAVGELGGRGAALGVGGGVRLRALEEPRHVHRAHAVLLADAAVRRLVSGMRVHVDQARHHQPRAPVHGGVGRAAIRRTDMGQRAVVEDDVDAAPVFVAPRGLVPGDDPIGVADGRDHRASRATAALW